MLSEAKNVRQIENESFRRWFSDEFFELIVWFSPENEIRGFQLCYDIQDYERAITWKKDEGYMHNRIDGGESSPMEHKQSPILVSDGVFDKAGIAERFRSESREIDKDIADFVYKLLLEY